MLTRVLSALGIVLVLILLNWSSPSWGDEDYYDRKDYLSLQMLRAEYFNVVEARMCTKFATLVNSILWNDAQGLPSQSYPQIPSEVLKLAHRLSASYRDLPFGELRQTVATDCVLAHHKLKSL